MEKTGYQGVIVAVQVIFLFLAVTCNPICKINCIFET
jgi:hypothetical protein